MLPKLRLVLAAGEADPCLIPREYRVALPTVLGGRREVGAQADEEIDGDAERVQADEDERDGGAAARAALDVLEAREHAHVVVLGAASEQGEEVLRAAPLCTSTTTLGPSHEYGLTGHTR